MRASVVGAMTVAALLVLAAGGVAGDSPSPCPTSAGMKDASKKTKPSSFAPRLAKPLITAASTAMPTAAETKF